MKNIFKIILFFSTINNVYSQPVKNTSYKNQSGEKVLRLEFVLPVNIKAAWQLFTEDDKLKKWIAPVVHIELKTGGYIITNYDSTKTVSDSSSIKLPIISFLDNEMIILKVNLNNNFSQSVINSDSNLQEIIQFKMIDNSHTKIISSMLGWGVSADWVKTYDFFVEGNIWTYNELLKHYK